MTGIEREAAEKDADAKEFDPRLDLIAPIIGVVGVIAAALDAGGPTWLAIARFVVGAAFLGRDHRRHAARPLVPRAARPGPGRAARTRRLDHVAVGARSRCCCSSRPAWSRPLNGTIDDGYDGLLSWFWVACAVTTIGLLITTRLALQERSYSAVMAATGLLYLAIITAFGTDLVARALLS